MLPYGKRQRLKAFCVNTVSFLLLLLLARKSVITCMLGKGPKICVAFYVSLEPVFDLLETISPRRVVKFAGSLRFSSTNHSLSDVSIWLAGFVIVGWME